MLWCVVLLNYADRQALSGTLPLIRDELHLSPHQQGMLGAAAIGLRYGWRTSFAVFGAAGIVLGFVLRASLRDRVADRVSGLPGGQDRVAGLPGGPVAETNIGNRATGQPGNSATGNLATRQPGNLLIALREIASPGPICLLLAFVCANAVASVLFVWLPTFVHDRFHQNLAVAGLSATVFAQLGSLLGAMLGGYPADRARTRWRSGRIVIQAVGLFAGA